MSAYDDDIGTLVGLTLTRVERGKNTDGNDALLFVSGCGRRFVLGHGQDCCESVTLEDVCGDLDDLLGYPIVEASENSNDNDTEIGHETWTFYRLSTVRGTVTLRWYGESNGYYSESVYFREMKDNDGRSCQRFAEVSS